MEVLKQLFEQHFHAPVERVQPVQGELGASGRKIVRLGSGDINVIGVQYDVREENIAFLEFSRHFRSHGLPVPEIYADDLSRGAYLEEDLGDTTLFEFLSKHRAGENISTDAVEAYRKVAAILPRFQVEAGTDINYKVCYPRAVFDGQSMGWDLNYFKYFFLRVSGIPVNEQKLEDDFSRLTAFLLNADLDFFLYRDFQSRNVMLRDGNPFFVDYQGGRRGALQYDIASLLFDAKADLPPPLRQQLLHVYLQRLEEFVKLPPGRFMRHYYAYVYLRIMQALGAYGFRGFHERKSHFLASVPYALKNVRWLLDHVELPIPLPTLMDAFTRLVESEKLRAVTAAVQDLQPAAPQSEPLTVHVFSFSYRHGLPKDDTGHGGGFVFDARGVPNPGRLEKFKPLTGRDAPVIEYLSQQESAHQFLNGALAMVDASVKAYQSRGFNSLSVAFGCTGGQHRSVYFAEQLAKRLRGRHGVDVVLRHLALETANQALENANK